VSGAGGNPKSENRDPKETRKPKPEFNAVLADQRLNVMVVFGFRISALGPLALCPLNSAGRLPNVGG
jgi:hypothetical protein